MGEISVVAMAVKIIHPRGVARKQWSLNSGVDFERIFMHLRRLLQERIHHSLGCANALRPNRPSATGPV